MDSLKCTLVKRCMIRKAHKNFSRGIKDRKEEEMKKYAIFTCLCRKTLVLFGSTLTSRSEGGIMIDRMKTGYFPLSKPMYFLMIWQRKLLTSICRIVLSSGLKNSHIFNECFSWGQQWVFFGFFVCCFKSAPGHFTHVDISHLLINHWKI